MNRFDTATSNVYSPEGTFLYNEKERADAVLGKTHPRSRRTTILVGGLGVLVLAAGYLAWRRSRAR